MNRFAIIAGVGLALASASPVQAMTDAECTAAWMKADANNDGVVTEAEGARYFAALRVANKTVSDGRMTQALFMENCKADLFVTAKADPGAPHSGANSFTEGQAKDRFAAAGLMSVSTLAKDANGVWRGTASDGSKTVNVALDYKGNVVVK